MTTLPGVGTVVPGTMVRAEGPLSLPEDLTSTQGKPGTGWGLRACVAACDDFVGLKLGLVLPGLSPAPLLS